MKIYQPINQEKIEKIIRLLVGRDMCLVLIVFSY
jgi:hypothetical protein